MDFSVGEIAFQLRALGLPGFVNYVMLRGHLAGFPWKLTGCFLRNPD